MKIGIFGGTFNPIHNGHVNLAKTYLDKLNLDKLLIVPANIPPHKDNDDVIDKVDRYNMCRIAFNKMDKVFVSDIEIRREGKSRTFDTLIELEKKYPDDDMYLIVGGDSFLNFDKWYRYEEILEKVKLCVSAREEGQNENIIEKAKLFKSQFICNITVLDINIINVSSTEIREKIQKNSDYKEYINVGVREYIDALCLYGIKRDAVKKYEKAIENTIKTQHRKQHSMYTGKEAATLAIKNGVNGRKAYIAGIIHDIAKEIELDLLKQEKYIDLMHLDEDLNEFKQLRHAYFGAKYIEINFPELDKDIIDMVKYHVAARKNSTLEEKIVYLADLVEFTREYKNVEKIRELTDIDFLKGCKYAIIEQIRHLIKNRYRIIPNIIYTYNEL